MTKLIPIFAIASILGGCIAQQTTTETTKPQNEPAKTVASGFEGNFDAKNKSVKIGKDTLAFSSKTTSYSPLATTKKGLLKPNTDYVVKMKVNIDKDSDPKGFLHVIVRDANDVTPYGDLYRRNYYYAGGKDAEMRAKFRTPKTPENYLVHLISHGTVSGEVSDFEIKEGTGEDFYPATPNAEKYVGDLGKLPAGCPEFEVDLPKPAKEIVVNAADFGLNETAENCVSIINKAIAHCKKIGATKLVLPKGKYKCYENSDIRLEDMTDFTFDGGGSTLVYRKEVGAANMVVRKTLRLKIENLNFDWDWDTQPLAGVVELVNFKKDGDKPYGDFKFVEYEKYPYYGKKMRMVNMSSYDIKAGSVGVEGQSGVGFFGLGPDVKWPEIEWLTPNTVRVYIKAGALNTAKKGNFYRVQHYYYGLGGVVLDSNTHTTLENVNVYSCKGHAFLSTGTQQYFQFLNVNIVAPKGAGPRPITCTADHFHFAKSRGYFKMIGCEFSRGADDCINVHDSSSFAVKVDDHTVKMNCRTKTNVSKGELVELRNSDYSPTNFKAKAKEIRKQGDDVFVVFEEKLPEQKGDGFVLFGWNFDSSNILIKDSYFHSNRARGLLILGRNVTIENCRFFRTEMGALKFETGYTLTSWCEGYGVDNVVVRNCTFESANPLGVKNQGKERDIFMGVYMKSDPSDEQTTYPIISNILFENNSFKDSYGLIAFIASTGNVIFKDNRIEASKERLNPMPYRGSFFVTSSSDTKIVNNVWVKSPLMPFPGVFADSDNVKDIIVGGNNVVEK